MATTDCQGWEDVLSRARRIGLDGSTDLKTKNKMQGMDWIHKELKLYIDIKKN